MVYVLTFVSHLLLDATHTLYVCYCLDVDAG